MSLSLHYEALSGHVRTRAAAGKDVSQATRTLAWLQTAMKPASAKSMAISSHYTPDDWGNASSSDDDDDDDDDSGKKRVLTARIPAFLHFETFVGGYAEYFAKGELFSPSDFHTIEIELAEYIETLAGGSSPPAAAAIDDDDSGEHTPVSDDDDDDDDGENAYNEANLRRELTAILEWRHVMTTKDIYDVFVSETPLDRLRGLETWMASCIGRRHPRLDVVAAAIVPASIAAIAAGHLPVFQFIARRTPGFASTISFLLPIAKFAAKTGNIPALEWILDISSDMATHMAPALAKAAAQNAQLAVLQLLDGAVDWALAGGQTVLEAAAENGNVPVLQWLASRPGIRLNGNQSNALRIAAGQGHVEAVQWLAAQPGVEFWADDYGGLEAAAEHGHWPVVKWFFDNDAEYDNYWYLANLAVQGNHLLLLQQLAARFANNGLDLAENDNYLVGVAAVDPTRKLAMTQWLVAQPGVTLSERNTQAGAMAAARENNVEALKWFIARPAGSAVLATLSRDLFIDAAGNNATNALSWLAGVARITRQTFREAFLVAARQGQRKSVRWFASRAGYGDIVAAQRAANDAGKRKIVRLLNRRLPREMRYSARA